RNFSGERKIPSKTHQNPPTTFEGKRAAGGDLRVAIYAATFAAVARTGFSTPAEPPQAPSGPAFGQPKSSRDLPEINRAVAPPVGASAFHENGPAPAATVLGPIEA